MNEPPEVSLVPFTPEWLGEVEVWFDHPEVRRRLGGRSWPARELCLLNERPGGEFRGRRVLRAHAWVVLDDQSRPVGHVGGDVYDRWTRYEEGGSEGPRVLAMDAHRSMGLAYVIDPDRWRRGFGKTALRAVIEAPEVSDVRLFVAGIDADNFASQRCALAAGFSPESDEPDWEGMIHYRFSRS
ncbi:MAG: GNAT family N-acetyltransferase [Rubrobacteraceae bacterium]